MLHQILIAEACFKRCLEKSTCLLCDSGQDFWRDLFQFQFLKEESLSVAETEVTIHGESTVLEVDGSFDVSKFFNVDHQLFKHPGGLLETLTSELISIREFEILIKRLSGKSGSEIVEVRENFKLGILR